MQRSRRLVVKPRNINLDVQRWRHQDGAMVLTKGAWQAVVTPLPGEHAFGMHQWVVTRGGKVLTSGETKHNRGAMGRAWHVMAAMMALVDKSDHRARAKGAKTRQRVQEMLDASK